MFGHMKLFQPLWNVKMPRVRSPGRTSGNNAGAQAGYAAAQSFILFIIIMLVTVVVRRFDRDSTKEAR